MHNGEIGGGRPRINKETFCNNYSGIQEEVELSNKAKTYFFISSLKAKDFPQKVAEFVYAVDFIKQNAESIADASLSEAKYQHKKNLKDYFDEYYGLKEFTVNRSISYNSRHGEIVQALKKQLQHKKFDFKKDGQIDLAICTRNKITCLFEIKTTISSQSIYTAIGQLFLYSKYNKVQPKKFFVCPLEIKESLKKDLKELGIEVLTYKFSGEKIIFQNIDII
jgi:hypothetical protein